LIKTAPTPAKKTVPAPVAAKKPAKKSASVSSDDLPGSFIPYQEQVGEDYMNSEQKVHFQHLLLSWKSELMEEVDRTVNHMKDEAANFPDPADRATQEERVQP
jgi:DnaK suppressor protein